MNIPRQAKTLPLAIAYLVLCGLPAGAEEYKTADEAFRAGARLHNQRDYRAAKELLERLRTSSPAYNPEAVQKRLDEVSRWVPTE